MTERDKNIEQVDRIVASLKDRPGALLPILHAIQDQLGYVPPESVPTIAEGLNLTRADVHGVITFYHYYRSTPPGLSTIHVCRAEACQAMGAEALEAHIQARLKIGFHENTEDGAYSLEPVYCLGNCACAPSIMIDKTVHGRVSPERFDQLIQGGKGKS